MLFGEDPPLPGDMAPIFEQQTLKDILEKVKANVDRPLPQTSLHKQPTTFMPDSTKTCTHVMVKRPKKHPLSRQYDGPFKIQDRLGDSALRIIVGEYANGTQRMEVRHWNSCYPYTPSAEIKEATRPALGRKPLNAKAAEFSPTNDTRSFTTD